MSPFAPHATIVLVHGAWADGSCWQNVILPLRKAGLKVTCAPIPLTSLTEDIAALERVLERTSGPAVLVGHAYAGAIRGVELSTDGGKSWQNAKLRTPAYPMAHTRRPRGSSP